MKNIVLTILLLITCSSAIATQAESTASYMKCNGVDGAGNSVYLISYPNSSIVNINGDMLNIVGKTRNGLGVYTQNFVNILGVLVYDSLVPVNNNILGIYQFNAITENLLAQAFLSCTFYGNAAATTKLVDQNMFSSIKNSIMKSTNGMPFNKANQSENMESSLSNSPIDACLAKVDDAIQAAKNRAASQGMYCTPADIQNRMTIAISKGACYGSIDKVKLCQIKIDAMVASGKGCGISDSILINNAKTISGC